MTSRPAGQGTAGPLEGIRVLDLGSYVAAPFAALLLGDLGADVIKIEPPAGDPARRVPPFLNGESRFFVSLNRNKRGLALDLQSKDGRRVVEELLRHTDVVVENFRYGVAERLDLDYPTLARLNPRVIHCSVTGFGTRGPLKRRPAFDGALQAMAGIDKANERVTGKVAHSAVLVVDYTTALLSMGAITTALYHRERTGEGQKVELSLLQSAMTILSSSYCEALDCEIEGPLGGYPYRLFDTADSMIFIGVAQDSFWPPFCAAVEMPQLAEDPRYRVNVDRQRQRDELNAVIEPVFRRHTTTEWEERMGHHGVPHGPVFSAQEFFAHPQIEAMGLDPRVEHSRIGPMRVFGVPFHFHKTPGSVRRAAPCLGEHNAEILAELALERPRT